MMETSTSIVGCLLAAAFVLGAVEAQAGDFAELNAILYDASIYIGDASAAEGLVLDLDVMDLVCTNLAVGDMDVSSRREGNENVYLEMSIVDLNMKCDFNYYYRTLVFSGNGRALVESAGNDASTTTRLQSRNFDYYPPTVASLESCSAQIHISKLDFLDGGIIAVAPVEELIARLVERQAQRMVCDELSKFAQGNAATWLRTAKEYFDAYPANYYVDPLSPEKELVTLAKQLLNLREKETHVGRLFQFGLGEAMLFLSEPVFDPHGVTDTGEDLRINTILRDLVLEDRALVMSVEDLRFTMNGVLWETVGRLTETKIILNGFKLFGLDTMTKFKTFDTIGDHTMQNVISWRELNVEFDLTVDIKPSRGPDSVIQNPGSKHVVEHVKVTFGVRDLNADHSVLVAIFQDLLESVQLGSLLNSKTVLPCLLRVLLQAEITALPISIGSIHVEPTLEGFLSPGLDRVVTKSVLAAFQIYRASLLRSIPAFFQKEIRSALNEKIRAEMRRQNQQGCPLLGYDTPASEFVDFRDLLLEPELAVAAGATGTEPYGDLASMFASYLHKSFVATNDGGFPKVNEAIRVATNAQSGRQGQLVFADLYTAVLPIALSEVRVDFQSLTVTNLDTVRQPLQLLNVSGPHRLNNSINTGQTPSRPVSVSTGIKLNIAGTDDSPVAVDSLLSLKVSFQSSVALDVYATVMKRNILAFPLRDLTNAHCWLAALPAPDTGNVGNVLDRSSYQGLQLSRFELDIRNLDLDLTCTSCSSPSGQALPEIMAPMKDSGALRIIEKRFERFVNDMVASYVHSIELHRWIAESRRICPHSPNYDSASTPNLQPPDIPALSRDSVESFIMLAAFNVNFGMVLLAKDHLLRPVEPTNPLSGQQMLRPQPGTQLLAWDDLGSSLGEWAASGIDEIRSSVVAVLEDEAGKTDLRANVLVRNWLQSDALQIDLSGSSVKLFGTSIDTSQLRIFGLDTVYEADILSILAPQTFSNKVRFEMLRLEVDIKFGVEDAVDIATYMLELRDVGVDVSLLLAVDWQIIGNSKLGSFLSVPSLLQCLISKLHAFRITQLLVSADEIESRVVGFLSDAASSELHNATERFLDEFSDDLVQSIPKLFDSTVRQTLNHVLQDIMANEKYYCSVDWEPSSSGKIDFRDLLLAGDTAKAFGGSGNMPYGATFHLLYQVLKEQMSIFDERNQSAINEMFIRPYTAEQSSVNGSLLYSGEVFNTSGIAHLGNWEVSIKSRLSDVRVENLDSVGQPLDLLQPVRGQASVLNNSLSVGVGPDPLRLAATLVLALADGKEFDLRNEIDVILDFSTITVALMTFLPMSESSLFALPLKHLPDINCLLSTISPESLSPDKPHVSSWFQYELSARKASLNISCVSCSSPLFDDLLRLLYNPGETEEEAETFIKGVQKYLNGFLGSDFLLNLAREIVSDAARVCPVSPDYNESATFGAFWLRPETFLGLEASERDSKMFLFNVANTVVAIVLVCSILAARLFFRCRNRQWLQRLPQDQVDIVRRQDEVEREKERYVDSNTESMFKSEQIPRRIRLGVPIVVLTNIGLYIGAHVALLSYLNVEANIAGEHFTAERFLEFSFFEAAARSYRNGGNEMAIFLIFFSGIFPYLKLAGALILWFVHPKRLSVARRGKLLLWMDVLTKLSIIDIVTMLLAIAALLVYIGGPGEESYNADELYAMTLVVVPQAGFYCIVIAQRLNRVASRFFLDYHHKIVSAACEEFKRRHGLSCKVSNAAVLTTLMTSSSSSVGKNTYSAPEGPISLQGGSDLLLCDSSCRSHGDILPVETASENVSPASVPRWLGPLSNRFRRLWSGKKETSSRSKLSVEANMTSDGGRRSSRCEGCEICDGDKSLHGCPPNIVAVYKDKPAPDRLLQVFPFLAIPGWAEKRFNCLKHRFKWRGMMGGTIAVMFAGVFVLIVFIIGCALAPSMSLDVKEVLGLVLESGRTYADAVHDFNVFRVVSLVLLKTRFVLSSPSDYVGLGILIMVAVLAVILFPAMQAWKMVRAWCSRRTQGVSVHRPNRRESYIPGFTNRLKVWHHMEVYVIAFCIASWELGAVVSYVIHIYCDLLNRLYEALGYVGLVQRSTSNCFRVQATDPFTLLILIGSFAVLLVSFVMQMMAQYKKNREYIEELRNEQSGFMTVSGRNAGDPPEVDEEAKEEIEQPYSESSVMKPDNLVRVNTMVDSGEELVGACTKNFDCWIS